MKRKGSCNLKLLHKNNYHCQLQLVEYYSTMELFLFIFFQNLYGHAQMMKLPISDFEWMTQNEIENFDISKEYLDGDTGYILECDLHYPKKLHNKHANLPHAPEVIEIDFENLSPYAKNALLESDSKQKYKDVKLTSTFHDRIDYVVHGKNLKLYLDLGMQLITIKRILKFKQDTFIAKYIQKCTNARQKAQTKFETSQFKKLANCVYGKTMQNVRDYMTVKLHTTKKSALNAIAKPTYKNHTILSKSLIQTNHYTPIITHDKPIAIGVSILELVIFTLLCKYDF